MRVLAVGDVHARTTALSAFDEMSEAILRRCDAVRPDRVVLLGDLLHEHARIHTAPYNAVLSLVDRLRHAVPGGVFVLIGNHDLPSNQVFLEPKHAFNAVKRWDGLTIVDDVLWADGFVFAPFVPTGRFVEALEGSGVPWREARAIFAHQEFKGARQGVHVSEGGDSWKPEWPLVISGHYHAHQWPKANLCYVGSPAAHDFGDDEDHTISLFTFPGDGTAPVEERLDLGLPKRRTYEVSLRDCDAFVPPAGEIVRLVVLGEPAALIAFRRSAAYRALNGRVARLVLKAADQRPRKQGRTREGFKELLARYVADESDDVKRMFAETLQVAKDEPGRKPAPRRRIEGPSVNA